MNSKIHIGLSNLTAVLNTNLKHSPVPLKDVKEIYVKIDPPREIKKGIFKWEAFSSGELQRKVPQYREAIESFLQSSEKEIKQFYDLTVKELKKDIYFSVFQYKLGDIISLYFEKSGIKRIFKDIPEKYTIEFINTIAKEKPCGVGEGVLIGFYSNCNSIVLDNNYKIIRKKIDERKVLYNRFHSISRSAQAIIQNEFFLITSYPLNNGKADYYNFISNKDVFLKFCRLFKSGTVDINTMQLFIKHGENGLPRSSGAVATENSNVQNEFDYILEKKESVSFRRYWGKYISTEVQNNKILNVVIKRFDSSYYKNDFEDKIIDLMIAYEALFLKENEKSELVYKLSLRVSAYFGNDSQHKKDVFEFIKKCYDLRSRVVHGAIIKSEIKVGKFLFTHKIIIDDLRRILRFTIRNYILKYSNLKVDDFINSIDDKIITHDS